MKNNTMIKSGPILNAYPDSIGGTLKDIIAFLKNPELKNVFQSFYILPSIFNTDLDRGFSVIDYNLNEVYADYEDIGELKELGINLMFDFVLNHSSVLSKQFQDIIKNGSESKYLDFFINWNKFWEGKGELTNEGYIMPDDKYIKDMFFRKPGLPILMVRMPDGSKVPYWNTFYQAVSYPEINYQDLMDVTNIQYLSACKLSDLVNGAINDGKEPSEIDFDGFIKYKDKVVELLETKRKYLGQMDLNIKSPLVWEFYDETLRKLSEYGAKIVRLDAFAYAPKEPGEKNFLNEPGTWELLDRVEDLASGYGLKLLPEIHSRYEEKTHEQITEKGYMTYDFFLPGLIIYTLESGSNEYLKKWITDIQEKNITAINMLGCHDGIPLLDLKGLLPDEKIEDLIKVIVDRGGRVKDLHGKKNIYYQVNSTYYSALGEDDKKMLLARAIQIFMPGIPQVWYLDLFAGKNDYEAVKNAGAGGHKEINRTNISLDNAVGDIGRDIVRNQLKLIQFRNTFPAFDIGSELTVCSSEKDVLELYWQKDGYKAILKADLKNLDFSITAYNNEKEVPFEL